MRLAYAFAVLAASSTALAQRAQPTDQVSADHATADEPVAVGIAINPPLRWADAGSIAASGYIAFAQHHALRLNFATYTNSSTLGTIASIAAGADGDEAIRGGTITDVGIGYQHYSGGLFDGLTIEAGLLRRAVDTRVADDYATPSIVETRATGFAGRALLGWSWLWSQRVFLAASVGVSVGRFSGTERTAATMYMPVYTTKDFVRYETVPEGYLRIGLAFGL